MNEYDIGDLFVYGSHFYSDLTVCTRFEIKKNAINAKKRLLSHPTHSHAIL